MKAAVFEKPHSLKVTSKPLRSLAADEILVKVDACGVCGTDVHILDGTSRSTPPVVLGHEYAGTVEAVGTSAGRVSVGARVAIDPNISCGHCYFCRRGEVHLCANLKALGVDIDGGMAQYCIVPERQAHVLPRGFPPDASAFVEPVSCVIHGVDRANIKTGDTVVIIGGGTIGLMMLQLVRHAGANRLIVIEPVERKQNLARQLGAHEVVDPKRENVKDVVFDLTGVGGDVVIECAGTVHTAGLALELARRGATVEFFGVCPIGQTIPVEPNQVYFKELTIVGSYVNPNTFPRAIEALHSGIVRVDAFQVSTFPLEEVHEALQSQREGRTIKSIILPNK